MALGLNGAALRGELLRARERPKRRTRASIGWLTEGLAERDARRGLARSSAALSVAASAASALAPSPGLATFDVVTDARGRVTRVTLVSFGSSGHRWRKVARRMERQLRRRRLRVPRGARGLHTRLRISSGTLAASKLPAERRLKREAAVGRGLRPARDVPHNESTQASGELDGVPTASPTLGATARGSTGNPKVRVVLIHERVL